MTSLAPSGRPLLNMNTGSLTEVTGESFSVPVICNSYNNNDNNDVLLDAEHKDILASYSIVRMVV